MDSKSHNATLHFTQSKDVPFGVCTDTVALCNFVDPPKDNAKIIELGCGSGYISICLASQFPIEIIGIDMHVKSIEEANVNLVANESSLKGKVSFKVLDVGNASGALEPNTFDAVIANPPYRKQGSGRLPPDKARQDSIFEGAFTLDNWAETARKLLKPLGNLYLSFIPSRLDECIEILRSHKLQPKVLKFIHARRDAPASIVLIKSVKGANPGITIAPPDILLTTEPR